MEGVQAIWIKCVKNYKREAAKQQAAEETKTSGKDNSSSGGPHEQPASKIMEIPAKTVLDFLEQEKIVTDREKARELIRNSVDPSVLTDGKCSFDDFTKLFCKGIFKHALMRIAKQLVNQGEGAKAEINEALSLETKMNTYNRQKLINGLDFKHDTHKEVMRTLGALDQINLRENPDYLRERKEYQEYLKDPGNHDTKQKDLTTMLVDR